MVILAESEVLSINISDRGLALLLIVLIAALMLMVAEV